MESPVLYLKCKTKTGQHFVNFLTHDSTVDDLTATLHNLSGIDPSRLRILRGYPPTPLDTSNGSVKLSQLLPQTRDTLIVEELHEPVVYNKPNYASVTSSAQARTETRKAFGAVSAYGGTLKRRVVPSNNSCLFTSVYFCISGGEYDEASGPQLRAIIASCVSADPATYNEGFLGRENKSYCEWILVQEHWGGAIELSILSKHYGVEIVAVDTQNVRLNRFGEDRNYDQRILLIYDGIHYDPLMLEIEAGAEKVQQTIFSTKSDEILVMAMELAQEAKASRQYTDVQNFALKCLVCQVHLRGQAEARNHAKQTGHTNFGEI